MEELNWIWRETLKVREISSDYVTKSQNSLQNLRRQNEFDPWDQRGRG